MRTRLLVVFINLAALAIPLVVFKDRLYRLYANYQYPFPHFLMEDAVRGWRNQPGKFEFRYAGNPDPIVIPFEIGREGERLHPYSFSEPGPAKAEVLNLGCSFAFGWGVNSDETYVALTAKSFPAYHFLNHGVGGYGLYQSLLTLRQLYEKKAAPRVILVGLGNHQEERNTASRYWRSVIYIYSNRGHAKIPYVRLDDKGSVKTFPPEGEPSPYLCRFSAFLCGNYFKWFIVKNYAPDAEALENQKITESLLLEMKAWATSHSSYFLPILMDTATESYRPFLQSHAIDFLIAEPWAPLPYDPHPNQKFHRDLAEKLSRKLNDVLNPVGVSRQISGQ